MTATTLLSWPLASRAAAKPSAAEIEVAACAAPKGSYSLSARRVHHHLPFNLRLNSCFPIIHMTFEEDCVNPLGKVGPGGAGRVGLYRKVQVGQLGPYLAVVDFFVGLRGWSGWEVVVPCNHMIKCRSALLAFPCMLLLCMEIGRAHV